MFTVVLYVAVLAVYLVVVSALFGGARARSPEERAADDEEQAAYLAEWAAKHPRS